jgi:hypothetical protein
MFYKPPSGLLEYYGLADWWQSAFSDVERKIISSTFRPINHSESILVSGRISSSSGSAVSLLSNLARWFMKEQTRTIAYRMIEKAEALAAKASILHRHYLYQSKSEIYYRFRHKDDFALQQAIEGCEQQIALSAEAAQAFRNLSKSKLLAFRQCSKRLWLEVYRPELQDESSVAETLFQVGHQVGEIERRLYDPNGLGTSIDVEAEGVDHALARSSALLDSSKPIFQAGFAAERALAFTDIMLPVGNGPKRSWRVVEVKSATTVKDYYRDDVAIQAFVTREAGVQLDSIALAHIDGEWTYPGNEKYEGLLTENDLTNEAFERGDEVRKWIVESHDVLAQPSEPQIRTGPHCSNPHECSFRTYCRSQEAQPEYPVEWLPALKTDAVKHFIDANAIKDLRSVPDEYLGDLQRRVKTQTVLGKPFFDSISAAEELARHKLPVAFLDFEIVNFAVPIWKGTRPYQHIPYQFSLHHLSSMGKLDHSEFLDLSGDDPSERLAEALIAAFGQASSVFVYNAGFETARTAELADRFPRLGSPLFAINERIVDLLPVVRRYYYHPSQHGSWSLKSVLPTIATDISYDSLDGVKDGGMAMAVYLEAIRPQTAPARKDEIRKQLLNYCSLDTYALVRLWQYFASPKRSVPMLDLNQSADRQGGAACHPINQQASNRRR